MKLSKLILLFPLAISMNSIFASSYEDLVSIGYSSSAPCSPTYKYNTSELQPETVLAILQQAYKTRNHIDKLTPRTRVILDSITMQPITEYMKTTEGYLKNLFIKYPAFRFLINEQYNRIIFLEEAARIKLQRHPEEEEKEKIIYVTLLQIEELANQVHAIISQDLKRNEEARNQLINAL